MYHTISVVEEHGDWDNIFSFSFIHGITPGNTRNKIGLFLPIITRALVTNMTNIFKSRAFQSFSSLPDVRNVCFPLNSYNKTFQVKCFLYKLAMGKILAYMTQRLEIAYPPVMCLKMQEHEEECSMTIKIKRVLFEFGINI